MLVASSLAFYLLSMLLESYPIQSLHEPPHDKTSKVSVRPAKTQISLGIRPVFAVRSVGS